MKTTQAGNYSRGGVILTIDDVKPPRYCLDTDSYAVSVDDPFGNALLALSTQAKKKVKKTG